MEHPKFEINLLEAVMPTGKNPESPPYLTMADPATIRQDMDAKDLDYINRFIQDSFEGQLVKWWREGQKSVKESVAKEQNKTETPMNIIRTFIILVEKGILSGPEGGRQKLYTINEEWAVEASEKARISEEKENREGEERERKATQNAKRKKEEMEEHTKALQELRGINSQSGADGSSRPAHPPAKKAKKVEQKGLFKTATAANLDIILEPQAAVALDEVKVPQSGIEEELLQEVTHMLTILLDGADEGVSVEKALEQCNTEQIAKEDFFRVLKWKHDQNLGVFVDVPDGEELSSPQCVIFSV